MLAITVKSAKNPVLNASGPIVIVRVSAVGGGGAGLTGVGSPP
jgi:hypothetical protein